MAETDGCTEFDSFEFPLLSNIADLSEGNDRLWEGVGEISCAASVQDTGRVWPSGFQPLVRCSAVRVSQWLCLFM